MIGVFDSGVGGLTVVKEIFKELPDYQLIYFGDTARLPYGTKGADFVKRYSAKITEWLLGKGAKLLVVACHTSSAWASESLKKDFSKVPIFEMISPGVKEALRTTKNKKIGLIGTPGTIKSGSWNKKLLELDPSLKIYSKPCPLFVPLVEEGWIDKKATREITKEYLGEFKNRGMDTLILACTHYPMLENVIQKEIGRKVKIINPAESLVKELKLFLENKNPAFARPGQASAFGRRSHLRPTKSGGKHQFFFSDQPYNFQKISGLCFRKKIKIKVIDPF